MAQHQVCLAQEPLQERVPRSTRQAALDELMPAEPQPDAQLAFETAAPEHVGGDPEFCPACRAEPSGPVFPQCPGPERSSR